MEKDISVEMQAVDSEIKGRSEIPVFYRYPELVYSLTNIVENAISFAAREVRILGAWDESSISIQVRDDGPGFSTTVLSKLGEPYISERPAGTHKAGGLGLGVFIAKTLIGRIGGTVVFSNRKTGGAIVTLSWPIDKTNAL